MIKALIIGGGFGSLYKELYEQNGHFVQVVDVNPALANFTSIDDALESNNWWDAVHICTPNFLHQPHYERVKSHAGIVFVEKPGFEDSTAWQGAIENESCRLVMVKNNLYRRGLFNQFQGKPVNVHWKTRNRVPHPGSWFTTKKLAFGGVSRDIVPHLLCFYMKLNPNWRTTEIVDVCSKQNYTLDDVADTDYGLVDLSGQYDVDDECWIKFADGSVIHAAWKTNLPDDISVRSAGQFRDIGLCPEECYWAMIEDAIANYNNEEFWNEQREMDLWIHQVMEQL